MREIEQSDITILRRRVNQVIYSYNNGEYHYSHSGDDHMRVDIHFYGSTLYAWCRRTEPQQPFLEVGLYDVGGLPIFISFINDVFHMRIRGDLFCKGSGIPRSKIHDEAYLFQISTIQNHHDLCSTDYEELFRLYDICVEIFHKEYS